MQDPPAADSEVQAPEGAIPQLPPEVPLQAPSPREGPYGAYNDPVEKPEGVYEQEPFQQDPPDGGLRRSPRIPMPTERYVQYLEETNPSFVAYESTTYMEHEIGPLDDAHPITAFKATSNPDTLYLHQADDWPVNGLWELAP
jgi:hypothetical protein